MDMPHPVFAWGKDPATGYWVPVAANSSGYLTTIIKGLDGATLRTLAVDASGNLVAVIKGSDGAALQTVKVNSLGELVAIMKGASGVDVAVDASGNLSSVMKGNNAGSLVTVAVDASGNIIGVLQGEYSGSLKTIAVDDQGRMLAVMTDPEDIYGNNHQLGTAELAARLGSVVNFDRRGQIIFADDFSHGLGGYWVNSYSGTKASIVVTADHAFHGGSSCHLVPGNANGNYAAIQRCMWFPASQKMGLEFSFTPDNATFQPRAELSLGDDTWLYQAYAQYDSATKKLQIFSGAGWVDVATITEIPPTLGYWQIMKLVVDFSTNKYARLICGPTSYDISAYDLLISAHPGATQFSYGRIQQKNTLGFSNNYGIYVGHVVITQGEP